MESSSLPNKNRMGNSCIGTHCVCSHVASNQNILQIPNPDVDFQKKNSNFHLGEKKNIKGVVGVSTLDIIGCLPFTRTGLSVLLVDNQEYSMVLGLGGPV